MTTSAEARAAARDRVHSDHPTAGTPVDTAVAAERLMLEFEGRTDLDTVSPVVRDCSRDLAGVPAEAWPELVERCARQG